MNGIPGALGRFLRCAFLTAEPPQAPPAEVALISCRSFWTGTLQNSSLSASELLPDTGPVASPPFVQSSSKLLSPSSEPRSLR